MRFKATWKWPIVWVDIGKLCNIMPIIIECFNRFMILANNKRIYLSPIVSRCRRKQDSISIVPRLNLIAIINMNSSLDKYHTYFQYSRSKLFI